MTSILALDLATTSGWAHWRPGLGSPIYGTIELPKGADIGRFGLDYRHELRGLLGTYSITDVVYEAPWVNPKRDDENIIMKLFGLATETAVTSREHGAAYQPVNTKAMRKFWTGTSHHDERKDLQYKGSDGKIRVCSTSRDTGKYFSILHARDVKGWSQVEGDDEADALGVLCFYCAEHKLAVPWDNRGVPSAQFLELAAKGRIVA